MFALLINLIVSNFCLAGRNLSLIKQKIIWNVKCRPQHVRAVRSSSAAEILEMFSESALGEVETLPPRGQ